MIVYGFVLLVVCVCILFVASLFDCFGCLVWVCLFCCLLGGLRVCLDLLIVFVRRFVFLLVNSVVLFFVHAFEFDLVV